MQRLSWATIIFSACVWGASRAAAAETPELPPAVGSGLLPAYLQRKFPWDAVTLKWAAAEVAKIKAKSALLYECERALANMDWGDKETENALRRVADGAKISADEVRDGVALIVIAPFWETSHGATAESQPAATAKPKAKITAAEFARRQDAGAAPWRKFDHARDAQFRKENPFIGHRAEEAERVRQAAMTPEERAEELAARKEAADRRRRQWESYVAERRQQQQREMELSASVAIAQAQAAQAQAAANAAQSQRAANNNGPNYYPPMLFPGPYSESINNLGHGITNINGVGPLGPYSESINNLGHGITNINGFGPFGPFSESINNFGHGITNISGFGAPYPFGPYGGFGGGY